MYVRMYVRMYVCTYVRMCVCTYVRMYVCTYVRMYVCTYVRMYVCTYVCMYVCMYVLKKSQQLSPVECSVEHAQLCLFLSLLSLGTVVLSHLSPTLSNVWMLVYRYVGLLYTYLDINTASWHVDNCCLHVITNKMLNANCCKRIATLLVKRTLIG